MGHECERSYPTTTYLVLKPTEKPLPSLSPLPLRCKLRVILDLLEPKRALARTEVLPLPRHRVDQVAQLVRRGHVSPVEVRLGRRSGAALRGGDVRLEGGRVDERVRRGRAGGRRGLGLALLAELEVVEELRDVLDVGDWGERRGGLHRE